MLGKGYSKSRHLCCKEWKPTKSGSCDQGGYWWDKGIMMQRAGLQSGPTWHAVLMACFLGKGAPDRVVVWSSEVTASSPEASTSRCSGVPSCPVSLRDKRLSTAWEKSSMWVPEECDRKSSNNPKVHQSRTGRLERVPEMEYYPPPKKSG